MKISLILAHPNLDASIANRALLEAVSELPDIEVADLHALYPSGAIDAEAETERLLAADRLVLQFPMYWYSTPPILKQWQDSVLTPMLYIRPDIGARLKGLPLRIATTLSGEAEAYREEGRVGFTVAQLLAPLHATARRAGLVWETPFIVHDMRSPTPEALALHASRYRAMLAGEELAVAA